MKRCISFLLAAILVMSLAGCGREENRAPAAPKTETLPKNNASVSESTGETAAASRVLIAYFSVPEDIETTDAVSGASIVVRDNKKSETRNMWRN